MLKLTHVSSLRFIGCSAALATLAACSGETVALGEVARDLVTNGSRCREATLVEGSVVIENQDQLARLEGCEQIEGDLVVRPFAGADFGPLAALTRVGGALDIGRPSTWDELTPEQQERIDEIFEEEQALLDAGWLASLAGFESLERAGRLALRGIGTPSLQPLSNLSTLTNGAVLELGPCTNLRDLTGLERLTGVVELSLSCESLESLAGPRFAPGMSDVIITGANLVDLGALAPERVNELRIEYTAIENVDALSGLTFATSIDLFGNADLTDADALDTLRTAKYLRIAGSPRLERLPELTSMFQLDALGILSNDTLANLPSLPNLGLASGQTEWGNLAPEDAMRVRPDIVQISGNAALESVVIPAGWLAVSFLDISGNANLASIDLSNLHAADGLYISTNPLLEAIDLGQLETIDDLRVIDNPRLALEPFDDLQTFRRIVQPGPLEPGQY